MPSLSHTLSEVPLPLPELVVASLPTWWQKAPFCSNASGSKGSGRFGIFPGQNPNAPSA